MIYTFRRTHAYRALCIAAGYRVRAYRPTLVASLTVDADRHRREVVTPRVQAQRAQNGAAK